MSHEFVGAVAACFFGFVVCAANATAGIGSACGPCKDWECQDPTIIRQVQAALKDKGEDIVADGAYGPTTQAAMRRFATKNGIADTRPTSSQLLKALLTEAQAQAVSRRTASAWLCN